MTSLKIKSLVKNYDETQVLKNINVDIKDGEFVVLVGPSGCGKSTLLRTIAGLEEINSGEIFIGSTLVNQVDPSDRGVAMVFQSYALYPHMDVFQNMSFGLKMTKVPKVEINEKVHQASKILKIEHLLKRKPKALSGGQRQRVAIGRAIVRNPEVFLFDEPLSNLDAELRVQMRIELVKLHNRLKSTMIYVTHDQVEAMTMADKIVVLRDGILEQVGTPDQLYLEPNNLFVAGFIGSPKMNVFEGTISNKATNTVITFEDKSIASIILKKNSKQKSKKNSLYHLKDGDQVILGVRPEHFHLEKGKNNQVMKLTTVISEVLGSTTHLHCRSDKQDDIVIEVRGNPHIANDKPIQVFFSTSNIYLFEKDSQRLYF